MQPIETEGMIKKDMLTLCVLGIIPEDVCMAQQLKRRHWPEKHSLFDKWLALMSNIAIVLGVWYLKA